MLSQISVEGNSSGWQQQNRAGRRNEWAVERFMASHRRIIELTAAGWSWLVAGAAVAAELE